MAHGMHVYLLTTWVCLVTSRLDDGSVSPFHMLLLRMTINNVVEGLFSFLKLDNTILFFLVLVMGIEYIR